MPWGTKEKREASMKKAAENDQAWCLAQTIVELECDMDEWKKAETEYKEHPELFEDLTEYDDNGYPYVKIGTKTYVMPYWDYNNSLERITLDDSKYSDLTLFDKVLVLLDSRKFVKRITENPNEEKHQK